MFKSTHETFMYSVLPTILLFTHKGDINNEPKMIKKLKVVVVPVGEYWGRRCCWDSSLRLMVRRVCRVERGTRCLRWFYSSFSVPSCRASSSVEGRPGDPRQTGWACHPPCSTKTTITRETPINHLHLSVESFQRKFLHFLHHYMQNFFFFF